MSYDQQYSALLSQQTAVQKIIIDLQATLTRTDLDLDERSQTEAMLQNAIALLNSYIGSISSLHTEVQNQISSPTQGSVGIANPSQCTFSEGDPTLMGTGSGMHQTRTGSLVAKKVDGEHRSPDILSKNYLCGQTTVSCAQLPTYVQSNNATPQLAHSQSTKTAFLDRPNSELTNIIVGNPHLQHVPSRETESVSYSSSLPSFVATRVSPHYAPRELVPRHISNSLPEESLSAGSMQLIYSIPKTYKYVKSVPKYYSTTGQSMCRKAVAKATNDDTPKWKHVRKISCEVWHHPDMVQIAIHEMTANIYSQISNKEFSKLEISTLLRAYNSLAVLLRFLQLLPQGINNKIVDSMLSDMLHLITESTNRMRAGPGHKRDITNAISYDFQAMLHLIIAYMFVLQYQYVTSTLSFSRQMDTLLITDVFLKRYLCLGDCLVVTLSRLIHSRRVTRGVFSQSCILAIFRLATIYVSSMAPIYTFLGEQNTPDADIKRVELEDLYTRLCNNWEAAYDCKSDSADGDLLDNVKPTIPETIGGVDWAVEIETDIFYERDNDETSD